MTNQNKEQVIPQELTDRQLEKVDGGTQAGNLLFTGKAAKPASTVQKGASPKAGSLVHKEVKATGEKKTIEEIGGIEGILLSGGNGPELC